MSTFRKPKRIAVVTVAITVMAASLVLSRSSGTNESLNDASISGPAHSLGMPVPPPSGFSELVGEVDLIVVGVIRSVDGQSMEGPYATSIEPSGEVPLVSDPTPTLTPEPPLLPVTYFSIYVEQVVMGNGIVHPEGSVMLRVAGRGDATVGGPMPKQGDRFVFALAENPDGQSYGPYFGPWSFYHLDLDAVTYADWERTAVGFANGMTPAAFIDALKIAAQAKAS